MVFFTLNENFITLLHNCDPACHFESITFEEDYILNFFYVFVNTLYLCAIYFFSFFFVHMVIQKQFITKCLTAGFFFIIHVILIKSSTYNNLSSFWFTTKWDWVNINFIKEIWMLIKKTFEYIYAWALIIPLSYHCIKYLQCFS